MRPLRVTILLTVFMSIIGTTAVAKPLKVYILSGQSNMEGHARESTFDYIGMDPKTAPILKEMRGPDGKPRVCDNAWISYFTGGKTFSERFGKLTSGYGAGQGGKIGPEFTFGIYMQKLVDEPILLIKTAWGGKSLHTDFRPPSAGPYQFRKELLEQFNKQGRDVAKIKADKAEATGRFYRLMMDHVKMVLKDVKRVCPAYNKKDGYELAGFVWFQGWNDMCDSQTYPNRDKPGGYDLYSTLMAQFIRDVRKDLSAPQMPFVIGVMGVGGPGQQVEFRKAMAATADLPEFADNVTAVLTETFWDDELVAAAAKRGKLGGILDTAHYITREGTLDRNANEYPGWKVVGTPMPEERTWRYMSFDPQTRDELSKKEGKRFRDVELPSGLNGWQAPDFDDSKWKTGQTPIGKGKWRIHRATVKNNADWGNGEFILIRTSFDLDAVDAESYRISVLARQGFHIYLNGHKIHTYIWWKNKPYYRAINLGPNEVKHLKKGKNILAVYANVQYERKTLEPYASIDVFLEGLDAKGKKQWEKSLESVISPEEKRIASGASNAGYHYMGSGKIMAQIGKAFAEAVADLANNRK